MVAQQGSKRRRFNEEDRKKLVFVFNEVKPTNEEDWESIALMFGSKFNVEDLKAQSEKMGLKADRMSPTNKLILQRLKDFKNMASSEGKRNRKKMKEALVSFNEFIVLNVPQTYLMPPKKHERSPEFSDDDDSFIHDCVTAPIIGPIEPINTQMYKISPRRWTPTAVKREVVDIGDDFETKIKLNTKYSKIYALNQVKPLKRAKKTTDTTDDD